MKQLNHGAPPIAQGRESFRQGRNNAGGTLGAGTKCSSTGGRNTFESGTLINPGIISNKDPIHHHHLNQSLNIDKPQPHLTKGQLRR